MIADLFKTQTHEGSRHARHYLAGLLSNCRRKNMERLAETLPDVQQQDLQHFITSSPWATAPVWTHVVQQASRLLGGGRAQMLVLDESGFAKKGDKSAGVARQYNGRLGKIDNCQVGVFSALVHETRATLTGARLYLPEAWTTDTERCESAGIPEAERVTRTKNELAWELIAEAAAAECDFDWVGMDAGYGRDQELLFKIAGLGKYFVADVDRDQLVWLSLPPGPQRPTSVSGSGARPVAEVAAEGWGQARSLALRTAENGRLKVKFWRRRVWIWPPGSDVEIEVWLLVTEKPDGKMQYSLCNAPEELTWEETAQRQGQRYFVERVFEEGKSQLGMGQYQVRQWAAWQHHMALVGLAMLFTTAERAAQPGCGPWLSTRDVVEMLAWYFVKPRTAAALSEQIRERHARRQQAQASKLRRQAETEIET